MDWLIPIEERLNILDAMRTLPTDEPTTTVDMLEADVRKLVAAVRLAEHNGVTVHNLIREGRPQAATFVLEGILARLRSGDVEGKR